MTRRALAAASLAVFLGWATAGGEAREFRNASTGDFDLYVLSLTWSPGFCASGGDAKAPEQCASGAGFLVHGLWPQYDRGYPTNCTPTGRMPLRSDLDAVQGVMPSEGLARYEWRKHGTCSGLPPSQYFAAIAAVAKRVAIPDAFGRGTPDGGAPLDIERAFVAANPGLRTDMVAVDCGRSDDGDLVLREVRVCLSRDLRQFQRCPDEVERGGCRARSIAIPAAQ